MLMILDSSTGLPAASGDTGLMVLEVTMRDDSMVHSVDKTGKPINSRRKGSVWYQSIKFQGGDRQTNEAMAVALCKTKWPEQTSYSVDLKEANTPAPLFKDLKAGFGL